MTLNMDRRDSDAVTAWHRSGAMRYTGSMLALLLATIVTDSLTLDAALVLLGAWTVTGLAFGALMLCGLYLRRWSLLLWPVAMCAPISALQPVAPLAAGLVLGIVVLSFLFIGLSQPPHWGLPFVLPAALLFVQATDLDAEQTALRLAIAAVVWIICSEVPAKLLLELRTKQRELEYLASTDSLTGVLNRTHLQEHLDRVGTSGAVVLVDVDRFKGYNDSHGHVAGDVALIDFATTLKDGVRSDDAVFRYGGEEFVVVMADISVEDAVAWVERVRHTWAGHASGLTFSAGVVPSGLDAIRSADIMLYEAKGTGRDRVLADERSAGTVFAPRRTA